METSKPNRGKWWGVMTFESKPLTSGDVLHILQILLLVGALGVGYEQFQQVKDSVRTHSQQLNRIVRILCEKDSKTCNLIDGE